MTESKEKGGVNLYDNAYGKLEESALKRVREETYGDDLGQSGWTTRDEYERFFTLLKLTERSHVLDVACGSGNPTLFMAQTIGCRVTGMDINRNGIAAARKLSEERGLASRATFLEADASSRLPFEDEAFDSVICIDAIIHLQDRPAALREWTRVLRTGGRLLFTDPTVVTGLVSYSELTVRSSIGYYVFAPPGENEKLINTAGLELLSREDSTPNMSRVSELWRDARSRHRQELVGMEGEANFDGLQRFLSTVHALAKEQRLSRFQFLCKKQ